MKESKLKYTYKISIIEGIFAQIYGALSTIGSSFITKLLVMLGASPMQFSMLSAIGQVSQVFQPIGVAVSHHLQNRKRACIWITFWGRILTLFLGLSFLFRSSNQGIAFVLLLLLVSAGLQSIAGNIWIAWISDIVPLKIRGRFFSRRNQFLISAGLIVSYITSFLLDQFEYSNSGFKNLFPIGSFLNSIFKAKYQPLFLSAVFVIATLLSIYGLYILAKQPDRKAKAKNSKGLFAMYKEPLKDKNFRQFLFYGIWWMMAIGVGSAFWGPFMLQKLKMSMFELQIYGSISTVATLFAYNFWGRFIDKNGNKTAMKICIAIGGLNPMIWMFMNSGNYTIIWFEALLSGFMWSGAGIVATNFVLSISPKGKEQVYSGIYGAVGGVSMMLTTLLSGVLYPHAVTIRGLYLEPEQIVFGVGGLLRWSAIIPLMMVGEANAVPLRKALYNVLQYNRLKINQITEWIRQR